MPSASSRLRYAAFLALVTTVSAGLGGCFGNESTEFEHDLMPLEENPAPPPTGTAQDPDPELLNLQSGRDDVSDYVYARAYLHADVETVWAAMQDPEVVTDRRAVASTTVTRNVEPDYEVSFRIKNVVEDIITVEFEVTWRQGALERDETEAKAPTRVVATYQKTWGTTFIERLEGSVELTSPAPGITELSFVERVDAAAGGDGTIAAYNRDLFASIMARVKGQPLPTY
jgi:hypothetical protein